MNAEHVRLKHGPDARYLTRGVVAVGNHLPVGIGDGAHAVVAVVRCRVDVGAHVGLAHHHRANRLHHLALVAVVVGLALKYLLIIIYVKLF